MKKITTLILALCLYISNVFSCSCISGSSFAEAVTNQYALAISDGIFEFKVLATNDQYVNVQIVKVWQGNYKINQEIKIWNYTRNVQNSCGEPSVSVSNFNLNERYISSFYKKSGTLDNPYDTIGQLYAPSKPCGTAFLRVAQDSVKGATFGKEEYSSGGNINTMEYNLPYDEFNRRFALKLEKVLEVEATELETDVKIFPNPTSNILYMKGISGSVKIVDSFGKVTLLTESKESINVSSLESGIYFIEATMADRKIRIKFIRD